MDNHRQDDGIGMADIGAAKSLRDPEGQVQDGTLLRPKDGTEIAADGAGLADVSAPREVLAV